jgi:hypothetical protein
MRYLIDVARVSVDDSCVFPESVATKITLQILDRTDDST